MYMKSGSMWLKIRRIDFLKLFAMLRYLHFYSLTTFSNNSRFFLCTTLVNLPNVKMKLKIRLDSHNAHGRLPHGAREEYNQQITAHLQIFKESLSFWHFYFLLPSVHLFNKSLGNLKRRRIVCLNVCRKCWNRIVYHTDLLHSSLNSSLDVWSIEMLGRSSKSFN